MIITRTPFRITLGGGGTDLPAYYSRYGGFIFAAAIDKYMFINLNRPIVDDLVRVKYTRSEIVPHREELQHEIAREALHLAGIDRAVEIVSMADVPAGTGLGSSSCYAVGLLNALHTMKRNLLVFYTGTERSSLDILSEQSRGVATAQQIVVESLHAIKEMGYQILEMIEKGNLTDFGLALDKHWQAKKKLSSRVSNPAFDQIYRLAKENGALGGKISGAGGGGFFVFYAEKRHNELRRALQAAGLREMRYRFDFEGTKVMANLTDGTFHWNGGAAWHAWRWRGCG